MEHTGDTTTRRGMQNEEKGQERGRYRSLFQAFTTNAHTHDPCINASHALLLCKVVRKWARFGSAASGFAAIAVLVTPDSPTAGSCGYACGAWPSIGGGVASRGDGVGDGDNDSEGVELVEFYPPGNAPARRHKRKGTRVSRLTDEKEAAPRPACTMAGGAGASAR